MTKIQIEAVFEDVLEKDVFQSKNERMTAIFVPKSWKGRRVLVLLLSEKDIET
jgi:putative transposon-encoded protein